MPDKPKNPLRQRLIDDMTTRRYTEKQAYVRHVRTFAAFLGQRNAVTRNPRMIVNCYNLH
jgi:hypothetical protein